MSNIYYAKRGNKIVRIDEDCIEKYKGAGYVITDMNGKVITTGTPRGVTQLTSAYTKLSNEVESLKAENATLKSENARLMKELDKFKSMPISDTPKQTRKRKQVTENTEVTE